MHWNAKYWDMITQLYWWPKYLGLRSINQKHWITGANRVSIPTELVNTSGPLYTRELRIGELMNSLRSKEEILNQIFNITFAIAPDVLIEQAFLAPLGFSDEGAFQSLGTEVYERYGWDAHQNITQHDALFVSPRSALAVEMKLSSSSWDGQIAKYAALLTWEEIAHGKRDNLGLLFIAPEQARGGHWRRCGLTAPEIDASFLDRSWAKALPKPIERLFAEQREAVTSALSRLQLGFISWSQLLATLTTFEKTLDRTKPGDQALGRLIDGFIDQMQNQAGTGLTNPE